MARRARKRICSTAVLALERTGSRESRETLAALAKGIPEASLTREAKAALQRLERLNPRQPEK